MLLFKFNNADLYRTQMFLCQLAFTLFVYFVISTCCTMIISTINDDFRHIRSINKLTSNEDQDILLFIFSDEMRIR